MDKRLVLSVAGSGKSTLLVDSIVPEESTLLVTYTRANVETLRHKVLARWGYIPNHVTIQSYFTFLHSFCYKPFLWQALGTKGVLFESCKNRYASGLDRYISRNGFLYSNRLSRLLKERNLESEVSSRIAKYYRSVLIDEVQDFGGHDFNFLISMLAAEVRMILVGDFHQHTFDTSQDGVVNKSLHDDYQSYIGRFRKAGVVVDVETLKSSRRCSRSVCDFVNNRLGIAMTTESAVQGDVVEVVDSNRIDKLLSDRNLVKLFYQQSHEYPCTARNWGECKGDDRFFDVCVVLNKKTYDHYTASNFGNLAAATRNKLYVALTRSRNIVYLIDESRIKNKRIRGSR